MNHNSLNLTGVSTLPTTQDPRGTAVHACMRFFAVLLTLSVGLGCAGSSGPRDANSPDNENNEEATEPQSEDSEQRAEADQDSDEPKDEGSRPAKKRRPKRRRHVQAAPEPEPPPMYRKPLPPPPVEAPPEEAAPAPAYSESADQGDTALEAEAHKRCRWKNVAPYRPEWANAITPPLPHQRKITSKPICPYGTPPAVVRVARQIAVQQTKFKR